MAAPQINPGEIAGWPLLKIVYRTDPDKIADLLPPGIEPGAEPNVHLNIYNVPVQGEPEYGVSPRSSPTTTASPGYYGIGLGIDQESAIFVSQETQRPAQVSVLHHLLPARRRRSTPGAPTRATRS